MSSPADPGIQLVSGGQPASGDTIEAALVAPPEPEPVPQPPAPASEPEPIVHPSEPEPPAQEPEPVVEPLAPEPPVPTPEPEPVPQPPEPVPAPVEEPVRDVLTSTAPESEPAVVAPAPIPQPKKVGKVEKPKVTKQKPPKVQPQPTAAAPSLTQSGADASRSAGRIKCSIPQPPFPPKARRLGHEGTVVLRITMSGSGHIEQAVVIKSSGFDELDAAAIAGVKRGSCEGGHAGSRIQPIDFNKP
ncbi:energy transducer TonB [Phyllobacterium sp. YR620]|uniref:energy transducer TonB n=1 Tax=Phyllobacterium sp. YR620 TaxID=1881066 RepID=UPI0011137810|nr:energy transducer TonB [Phyllobacterium sp. YR620]